MAWTKYLDFLTLHYAYILTCALLAFIVIVAAGNIPTIDAFFFACSGNTESGLNTIDVSALLLYQQLAIYFFPIITNIGFINIIVVFVRLRWFEKRLKELAPRLLHATSGKRDIEAHHGPAVEVELTDMSVGTQLSPNPEVAVLDDANDLDPDGGPNVPEPDSTNDPPTKSKLVWAEDVRETSKAKGKALRIPDPRERENDDEDAITTLKDRTATSNSEMSARRKSFSRSGSTALERIASSGASKALSGGEALARSVFVLGDVPSRGRDHEIHAGRARRASRSSQRAAAAQAQATLPGLSSKATIGRNSNFDHLTASDREKLGGIEYRSLKLLRSFVLVYFFGLHLLGVICLSPWIVRAPARYHEELDSQGIGRIWWAIYSAQTMVDNLGFTLTPTSMIPFQDATWPMLIMTFLAYAGNTFYPVFLRLLIWTVHKVLPKPSGLQEPLRFLLDHPRRCYTLLFPSRVTWILFSILFALNFIDTLLIVTLDLDNPAVNNLAPGPRVLAALFQAASARHTGTSTFAIAKVNPGVQFSLVVMMYISVFPIAISIRSSDVNEEKSLARYAPKATSADSHGPSNYIRNHVRSQLSFDLWYISAGVFAICAAESEKVMSGEDTAFTVFSILFEVMSAYGNVGLSLGTMATNTSLSGDFSTFGKLVICAMMLRGRHRGLPTSLDRAVTLPGEEMFRDIDDDRMRGASDRDAKADVLDERITTKLWRPKTM